MKRITTPLDAQAFLCSLPVTPQQEEEAKPGRTYPCKGWHTVNIKDTWGLYRNHPHTCPECK